MNVQVSFCKEEIREHNVMLSPLVPVITPNCNLSRRIQGTEIEMIPHIQIESAERRDSRIRMKRGWKSFLRNYMPCTVLIVCMFVILDKLNDYFSLEPWLDIYPVSIQRDYSKVQGISDLTTESIDKWCFVSEF
jgi:hypothetical protein